MRKEVMKEKIIQEILGKFLDNKLLLTFENSLTVRTSSASSTDDTTKYASYIETLENTASTKTKYLILWYLSADNDIDEVPFHDDEGTFRYYLNNDAFWLNHILGAILENSGEEGLSNIEILIMRDGLNDKESGSYDGYKIRISPIRSGFETDQSKLYRVDLSTGELIEIANYGELNMGSTLPLETFLNYALDNYSFSEYYYVLILSDHGGAWMGFGWDATSGNDMLRLGEIRRAIFNALISHGLSKLDMIIFEACLMGSIEVLYEIAKGFVDIRIGELRELASILIASENPMMRDGLAYALRYAINYLIDNPGTPLKTFARKIIYYYEEIMKPINMNSIYLAEDKYNEYNGFFGIPWEDGWMSEDTIRLCLNDIPTLTIFDVSKSKYFFDDLDNMIAYIKQHLEDNDAIVLSKKWINPYTLRIEIANMKWIMMTALQRTQTVYEDACSMKDFYDFVSEMANLYDTNEKQIFTNTLTSYVSMIVEEYHCPSLLDAHGMTIYFPYTRDELDTTGIYDNTLFNSHYDWLYILNLYYSTQPMHYILYVRSW